MGPFFIAHRNTRYYTGVMPREPVIPMTVLFPPDVYREILDFQTANRLPAFAKALIAMLAERNALLAEKGKV